MNVLDTACVEENEMAKVDDMMFGFKSAINNVIKLAKLIYKDYNNENNPYMVGGTVTKGNGLNIKISPFMLYRDTIDVTINDSEEIRSISQGADKNRIDIIGIRSAAYNYTKSDSASRPFLNPQGGYTYSDTPTKLKKTFEIVYVPGISGSEQAPTCEDDVFKLCEIIVPANATKIESCTIVQDPKEFTNKDFNYIHIEDMTTFYMNFINHINAENPHSITPDKINAVPSTRKINGQTLNKDLDLTFGTNKITSLKEYTSPEVQGKVIETIKATDSLNSALQKIVSNIAIQKNEINTLKNNNLSLVRGDTTELSSGKLNVVFHIDSIDAYKHELFWTMPSAYINESRIVEDIIIRNDTNENINVYITDKGSNIKINAGSNYIYHHYTNDQSESGNIRVLDLEMIVIK